MVMVNNKSIFIFHIYFTPRQEGASRLDHSPRNPQSSGRKIITGLIEIITGIIFLFPVIIFRDCETPPTDADKFIPPQLLAGLA